MSDSVVSINIDGTFDKLVKQAGAIPNGVIAKGADTILGSFGSEVRKKLGAKEARTFRLGFTQTKSYNKVQIMRASKFDSSHGWYKGQEGTRIIGFGYENLAYQQASKYFNRPVSVIKGKSSGYVYSLLNNLWGHDTKTYKHKSPYFNGGWYGSKFGYWKKGLSRPRKETYFNESVISEAVAPTMQRAETDLQKLLKENGF